MGGCRLPSPLEMMINSMSASVKKSKRKSPLMSATNSSLNVGNVRKGVDGTHWKVTETKTGTRRWARTTTSKPQSSSNATLVNKVKAVLKRASKEGQYLNVNRIPKKFILKMKDLSKVKKTDMFIQPQGYDENSIGSIMREINSGFFYNVGGAAVLSSGAEYVIKIIPGILPAMKFED